MNQTTQKPEILWKGMTVQMMEFVPEGLLLNTAANRHRTGTESALAEAAAMGEIVEARAVLCDGDHNLHVEFPCMKGIVPYEEGAMGIADGTTRDIALISRVSKPVCLMITGFDTAPDGTRRAVCSRRAVQQRCRTEYIDQLRQLVLLRSVFDDNADYVRPCRCKTEAIAAGSALNYIAEFLNSI